MRIGVTGANGFVGRAVLRAIASAGHDPIPLVRVESGLANEIVIGDISSDAFGSPTKLSLHAVVHLAARTHVMKEMVDDPLPLFRQVNVQGTRNCLQLANKSGATRFVYVSSIKVNGESTTDRAPFHEDDAADPKDAYGLSKYEAEKLVMEQKDILNFQAVIIRPPLVYGPGVGGNFARLIRLVALGIPLPFAAIRNARSMIFVDTLADAILACTLHPSALDKTFLVSDGQDLSTPETVGLIAQQMGRKSKLISIPPGLLLCLARIVRQKSLADRLCGSLQIDSSQIRATLGWEPKITVKDAIAKSVLVEER
jgi:UDP-4-keto-D-QuiNAc 4-reductase